MVVMRCSTPCLATTEEKVGGVRAGNSASRQHNTSFCKNTRMQEHCGQPLSAPATQETVQGAKSGEIDQLTVLHVHK